MDQNPHTARKRYPLMERAEKDDSKPAPRRRKEARPSEIIDVAMDSFIEKGFAATNLDEIAKKAGIAKGTLYLYFDSKESLFLAVAKKVTESQAQRLISASLEKMNNEHLTSESLANLLDLFITKTDDRRMISLIGMVLAESQNFPEIARIWHDEVAARALVLITYCISKAQERGEIKAGDPRIHALSFFGPFFMASLFRYAFGEDSMPDAPSILAQHLETVLHGLQSMEFLPEV